MNIDSLKSGPDCLRDDCLISLTSGYQTMTHYPPLFNKEGVNVNPDMNITYNKHRCLTCNKSWTETIQNGVKISTS